MLEFLLSFKSRELLLKLWPLLWPWYGHPRSSGLGFPICKNRLSGKGNMEDTTPRPRVSSWPCKESLTMWSPGKSSWPNWCQLPTGWPGAARPLGGVAGCVMCCGLWAWTGMDWVGGHREVAWGWPGSQSEVCLQQLPSALGWASLLPPCTFLPSFRAGLVPQPPAPRTYWGRGQSSTLLTNFLLGPSGSNESLIMTPILLNVLGAIL